MDKVVVYIELIKERPGKMTKRNCLYFSLDIKSGLYYIEEIVRRFDKHLNRALEGNNKAIFKEIS